MVNQSQIRNFAIIAHIDHGKSTLADRMLELCGVVKRAEKQTLDSNPIEKERGITIKLAPVRMEYKLKGKNHNLKLKSNVSATYLNKALETDNLKSETYVLNLIDTPGHVDFSYEVSRALAACEGTVLLVDATQGIQAQTLAHYREAKKLNLKIIPVLNKVDLASANIVESKLQLMEVFGFNENEILSVSAKTGEGVADLLRRIIEFFPPPKGDKNSTLRALVFNSQYDTHKGVLAWIKMVDGSIKNNDAVSLVSKKFNSQVNELGYFKLVDTRNSLSKTVTSLNTGEVGYAVLGLKNPSQLKIGDTLTIKGQEVTPLPGYNPPKPMIFASFYPTDQSDYINLGKALDKLKLLDSSLVYTQESSPLLGNGYRLGFLGILHAEIVQERLEREFEMAVFATQPSVVYEIVLNDDTVTNIYSANELPDPSFFKAIREPILRALIFTPEAYVSELIKLFQKHRGHLLDTKGAGTQVQMVFKFPLSELVGDFYSEFKSVSSGFASMDYEMMGYEEANLVKMNILMAGDDISALSRIVPKKEAEIIGRKLVSKLVEVVPRHNFEIAVQAAIGGKILARGNIKPFRKDVTAKLYGGDQTRKDKLLKKQKKGKKRLKQFGKVSLPPDMLWKLLK